MSDTPIPASTDSPLSDDGKPDDSATMTPAQRLEFVAAHHGAAAEHLAQAAPHIASLLGHTEPDADDSAAGDTDSPGATDAGEASRTYTGAAPAYSAQARGMKMSPAAARTHAAIVRR